jgi:thioesterase domain-containing protein
MRIADPMMGWERIARGGLELFVVQGNHLQIVREPNVKAIGEPLKICLEQVQLSLGNRPGNKST